MHSKFYDTAFLNSPEMRVSSNVDRGYSMAALGQRLDKPPITVCGLPRVRSNKSQIMR